MARGDSARAKLAEVGAYGRGIGLAARLRSWEPTVAPIWASSPTAWTAVVTAPGRPLSWRGGGGGAAGRWAAVALRCVAAVGDLGAFLDFAFVARADDDVVAAAVDDLVARAGFAARRSPPMRVGRVLGRVPRTLWSPPVFAVFFDFFLADFCVMDTVIAQGGRRPL